MFTRRIKSVCKEQPVKCQFSNKLVQELSDQLDNAKNQINSLPQGYEKYWRILDPFKNTRNLIVQWYGTQNVSNAWLKCYEMLSDKSLELCNPSAGERFVYFDNAAFPGSFILATWHYFHTIITSKQYTGNKLPRLDWYASSLFIQGDKKYLDDSYNLWRNYPERWLMDDTNNGDVTVVKNIINMAKKMEAKGKCHLYTSDIGLTTDNYNDQATAHVPLNIGQILCALLTLRKDGSMITKQYTLFDPINICLVWMLTTFFEEVYIIKPVTSRQANSEIYLVGKKFKYDMPTDQLLKNPYIIHLMSCLGNKNYDPFFENFDKEFLDQLLDIMQELNNLQIIKLNHDVTAVAESMRLNRNSQAIDDFLKKSQTLLDEWFHNNDILPLSPGQKLKAINIFDSKKIKRNKTT